MEYSSHDTMNIVLTIIGNAIMSNLLFIYLGFTAQVLKVCRTLVAAIIQVNNNV